MTEIQKVEFPTILNMVDIVYVLHSNGKQQSSEQSGIIMV